MTSVTLSFQYDPGPNQPVDMSAGFGRQLATPGGTQTNEKLSPR